jgi:hypothetical protein
MLSVKSSLYKLFGVIINITNYISGSSGRLAGDRSIFLDYDEDVNRDKNLGGASFDFRNNSGRKHNNPEGYQA